MANIMQTIKLPLHSFSGLITNSSSETFISATESTVKAAKALIQHVIGADKNVDELFDVKLTYSVSFYSSDASDYIDEDDIDMDRVNAILSEHSVSSYDAKIQSWLSVTSKTQNSALDELAKLIGRIPNTLDAHEYHS